MFPASTKGGGYTIGWPDVSKMPVGSRVVPIPYPNIGTMSGSTATKTKSSTGIIVKSKEAAILRTRLRDLNLKLTTMPGGNTTKWHEVVDDYVATTAQLFKLLSS